MSGVAQQGASHEFSAKIAHTTSHVTPQQNESIAHTQASIAGSSHPGVPLAKQQSEAGPAVSLLPSSHTAQ